MMHYTKGKNIEEELSKEQVPIECLPENFLWMHVKGGTKLSNVIDYAKKAFTDADYRSVVWSGSGGGVSKTISAAEIFKRNYPMHQVTRICYQKLEEYWDPKLEGLEQLVVTRQIPAVHILLSLDDIDPKTLGYQHSTIKTPFWPENLPAGERKSDDSADTERPGPSSGRNRQNHGPANRNNHKRSKKSKQPASTKR